jgi:hypothetical protein
MKKLIFLLLILFICQSCEKENFEPYNIGEEAVTPMQFSPEVLDYLRNLHNSNNNYRNSDDGPYWVAMYSDALPDFSVFASVSIPNTDMVIYVKYPTDGVDRALVNGEWIMSNWNIPGPYVFIADFSSGTPTVVYSNWCEEERSGHYHQRLRQQVIEIDLDGDGLTDIWSNDSNAEDSDGTVNVITDLTDGQIDVPGVFPVLGDCMDATTEIRVQGNIRIKNGVWKKNFLIDGVRYKNF